MKNFNKYPLLLAATLLLLFYLFGATIAWDINAFNWLLLKGFIGKLGGLGFVELVILFSYYITKNDSDSYFDCEEDIFDDFS